MKYISYIAILLFICFNQLSGQNFKLFEKDPDKLIYKLGKADSLLLSKIVLVSDEKEYILNLDSNSIIFKDSINTIVYKDRIPNYNNEIIYLAKIYYFDQKSKKIKSQSLQIYNESERINPRGESIQCYGTTKSGRRCSRYTTDPSGYCWQHK